MFSPSFCGGWELQTGNGKSKQTKTIFLDEKLEEPSKKKRGGRNRRKSKLENRRVVRRTEGEEREIIGKDRG